MKNYSLFIIRGGHTPEQERGAYVGHSDPALSPSSARLAAKLGGAGYLPTPERLYSSPMLRCYDAARLLFPGYEGEPIRAPRLKECSFGLFEGKTAAEIEALPELREPFGKWLAGGASARPPSGESASELAERAARGIDEVFLDIVKYKANSAALVSHPGIITLLLSLHGYPKLPPQELRMEEYEGFALEFSPFSWGRGIIEVKGRITYDPV